MSGMLRGAVIGSPVEHSLSPLLHREAFEFLGIAGTYKRQEVPLDSLATFFTSHHEEFDYLSITMPLKEEALALKVEVDSIATRIQSANTLYRRDNTWKLTSTDGSGLISALKHEGFTSFDRVLVLGAGGTARAVVGALDAITKELVVLGRTSTRREVLESAVTHANFDYLRWSDAPGFSDYDLVVNTTPAGAADLLADSLSPGSCGLLFDVIYKPWPTVLASRWSDSGGTVINGAELLLYQGIQQLSLALNQELDELALATHLRPILRKAIR
jgi:shikimate dehydrogenase